ncbi:hypothetical protein PI172_0080 [Prevotella intermedia]|uniref:Uncharacterized protein n=1 Tax=Prevotella intermedia TaxID=28131 RepID=A0AAD1BG18_PREIN|nr:hypothetical protein PI172_0080 [Prevotella intermedia]
METFRAMGIIFYPPNINKRRFTSLYISRYRSVLAQILQIIYT